MKNEMNCMPKKIISNEQSVNVMLFSPNLSGTEEHVIKHTPEIWYELNMSSIMHEHPSEHDIKFNKWG